MRIRPATGALISGLVLTLAASLGLSSTAGAAANDRGAQQPSAAAARQALADAQDALSGTAGKPTRDATMALRDLHKALPGLNAADRKTGEAILARPTDPGDPDQYSVPSEVLCGTINCLHWVESSEDAVVLTDVSPADGIPDYVTQVLATMEGVHATYVGAGYEPPKPDGTLGGTAQTDIYLANIGVDGLYGYCSSDEPVVQDQYDYWTYCVLDNDYSSTEFPGPLTPTQNMQVTAAHEYFHAVQGAYDWWEDAWLMEATATWAEDELFDDANDNVYYLPLGQLGLPWLPLDGFFSNGNSYGNWIFFRFLTEQIPAENGGMPQLVRTIWRYADSTNGPTNDQYSLQAVASALADEGYPFPAAYADFATVNRNPRAYYEEGAANSYPPAPLSFNPVTLTPSRNATTWGSVTQAHLTNDSVRFKPKKMKPKSWRLKVQVDMAPKARGSMAMVTVFYKNGKTGIKPISLSSKGDGAVKVPFSSSDVAYVELTVINASQRTTCWSAGQNDPWYSCFGVPTDDGMKQKFRGIASR